MLVTENAKSDVLTWGLSRGYFIRLDAREKHSLSAWIPDRQSSFAASSVVFISIVKNVS